MEKRVETLAELKGQEVVLRDKIEKGKGTIRDVLDLMQNRNRVKSAENRVLRTIMWLLVSAVIFLTGCQTFKGVTGDSAWILQELSDNITTEQEK